MRLPRLEEYAAREVSTSWSDSRPMCHRSALGDAPPEFFIAPNGARINCGGRAVEGEFAAEAPAGSRWVGLGGTVPFTPLRGCGKFDNRG